MDQSLTQKSCTLGNRYDSYRVSAGGRGRRTILRNLTISGKKEPDEFEKDYHQAQLYHNL